MIVRRINKKMTQAEKDKIIKDLQDKLAEAEKIEVDNKHWKPKNNEEFWYICSDGSVVNGLFCNSSKTDNWYYLIGNCFKTEEEAEEYKKQIEYTARYKNYIEEHSEPIDWTNEKQIKYFVYFYNSEICVDYGCSAKYQGTICASSKQIIWDAIKEIGEDNFKKYVLGVK